jgi:predicted AAA+ superfamily ATPase
MEILRKESLEKLILWKDKHFIKVITGLRRCGKSTLLNQYKNLLIQQYHIKDKQILSYDFNDPMLTKISYLDLYNEIINKSNKNTINYILLDEIQEIKDFEKCVIGLFEHKTIKFDIYITGSNSHMYSRELATLFTGRNIEINLMPLSFIDIKNNIFPKEKDSFIFNKYLNLGGLGIIIDTYLMNENDNLQIINNVLNDAIEKDIMLKVNTSNKKRILNIIKYIFVSVGKQISTRNIENFMKTNNGIELTHNTISKYIKFLTEAMILYPVHFYEVKTKNILLNKVKYYSGDLGLLTSMLSLKNIDSLMGFRLENLIFLELKKQNFKIYTFKNNDYEIDFICEKNNEIYYIQVCYKLNNDNFLRESKSLLNMKDNFKKIIMYYYLEDL